jgi:pyrimidine-nucleoside phosphorylase
MNPVELIRKKREGNSLTRDEVSYLISSYTRGELPDYQMSAFLMACFFRGMSKEETLTFTNEMLHSGDVIDLSSIPGIKVDKHSTGGVGDKVSLILAPIVAACGVPVPMISGRGLGHTGGTLDKLESIPGFRTDLSVDEYKRVIKQAGLVMMGQTKEIAPADKRMYALRDVTATVECIPLIAGSIMSKKLAEGIDALVLDVKTGRGAFMQTHEKSLELARTLVELGNGFGKKTVGYITDMNQPLGTAIGNWLEVVESVECLRGTKGVNDHSADLMEVTYVLSGTMVSLGGKARSVEEGIDRCKEVVSSGSAYKKFVELVHLQRGDVSFIESLEQYPFSKHAIEVNSPSKGFVTGIDSFELGLTGIQLGAGRQKVDDVIDPKAGIVVKKKVGDDVELGEVLAILYTDREDVLRASHDRIQASYAFSSSAPAAVKMIHSVIDADGVRKWDS